MLCNVNAKFVASYADIILKIKGYELPLSDQTWFM